MPYLVLYLVYNSYVSLLVSNSTSSSIHLPAGLREAHSVSYRQPEIKFGAFYKVSNI